jgi:SAM-dependent methyltransferase
MSNQDASHFDPYVQSWEWILPPLRPDDATLSEFARLVARSDHSPLTALLLGVTPEIAKATWLQATRLTAVDQSLAMMAAVWPGDTTMRHAVHGEWLSLPLASQSQDLVMGDGVLTLFAYPHAQTQLTDELARVLKPGGRLLLRSFCRPEASLNLQAVLEQAATSPRHGFSTFKLQLLMALQGDDPARGVCLHDAWTAFMDHFGSTQACAQRTQWPMPLIETIDLYRDNRKTYHLTQPHELQTAMAAQFTWVETTYASTDVSRIAPLMLWQRKGD